MERPGVYTYEEIFSQPVAWKEAIRKLDSQAREIGDFIHHTNHRQVIFTGCGSTYYLSLAAAALFQEVTGILARGIPASELWLSPQAYFPTGESITLIAISRSGETTETVQACESFRKRGHGSLITLACDPDSSLAKMGSLNLAFPSGMEQSIAQTRAFSTLYLGVLGLSALWNHYPKQLQPLSSLPPICEKILSRYQPLATKHGSNLELDRIYFLGSNGRYGLACELSLKMKEMSITHSEAFHFLEFRHGPKAMINRNTLVVGLVSETYAQQEVEVLKEMEELGAEIVTMGERDADISFESGLQEVNRNILYLPFGQMLAFERSIAKGFDPDHPLHLDAVVKLTN